MKPGVRTSPPASIVSFADSSTLPTDTILPSRMPTSPVVAGAPVPSTIGCAADEMVEHVPSPRLSVRDAEAVEAVAVDGVAPQQAVALVGVHAGRGEQVGGRPRASAGNVPSVCGIVGLEQDRARARPRRGTSGRAGRRRRSRTPGPSRSSLGGFGELDAADALVPDACPCARAGTASSPTWLSA